MVNLYVLRQLLNCSKEGPCFTTNGSLCYNKGPAMKKQRKLEMPKVSMAGPEKHAPFMF